MKKLALLTIGIILSLQGMAQQELTFPFQGGSSAMSSFFRDSITVSPDIIQKRATGMVIFKFTADQKGTIQKMVIYYADDYILTLPIIEALKKSNHKWIIPDKEKFHDFVLPFSVGFNPPPPGAVAQKPLYNFYSHRKPILSSNQLPLNSATLLPAVLVRYDIK